MNDLDNKEQDHVRAALKFLHVQMGGFSKLARALHFDFRTVRCTMLGSRDVCASMALRVARLIDTSIDDLLSGEYQPGVCAKCGHRPKYAPVYSSDFTDDPTAVESESRPVDIRQTSHIGINRHKLCCGQSPSDADIGRVLPNLMS